MTLVIPLLIVGILGGVVFGGSLRQLERIRLHWWGLAVVGLALQVVPSTTPVSAAIGAAAPLLLVLSYASLLLVLVVNHRLPASLMMMLGLTLNLVVVGVNGGMPVSPGAIVKAGGTPPAAGERLDAKRHVLDDDDRLAFLGDVIAIPPPIRAVVSIGDLLLYGGLTWLVCQSTRGRGRANPRPLAVWIHSYRGKHAPAHWRLPAKLRARASEADGRAGGNAGWLR